MAKRHKLPQVNPTEEGGYIGRDGRQSLKRSVQSTKTYRALVHGVHTKKLSSVLVDTCRYFSHVSTKDRAPVTNTASPTAAETGAAQ